MPKMNKKAAYTVYNLGLSDSPKEDRKIAIFYNEQQAIQYVEWLAIQGERCGVYDMAGRRIDEE